MVAGSGRPLVLAGLVVGLMVLGGLIGAGIDFAGGSQGWWGVLGLFGLMTGASLAAALIEAPRAVRAARPPRPAPRPR